MYVQCDRCEICGLGTSSESHMVALC